MFQPSVSSSEAYWTFQENDHPSRRVPRIWIVERNKERASFEQMNMVDKGYHNAVNFPG